MRKAFDLLREVSRFGEERGIRLDDPAMRSAFGLHVDEAVSRALKDPILLQGHRAEAMFEALVASLGAVQLIKQEDVGQVHTASALVAPDFRVVLDNGANWLVEVKNVYLPNAFEQRRHLLTRPYRSRLERYAKATGGILKLAVFWARWSIWTLIDPEQLAPDGQDLTLDMMTAIRVNEMAALGDQMLGLRSPLVLRLRLDPGRTQEIQPDGATVIAVDGATIFSGGIELVHPADQQIGWTIMQYSDWIVEGPFVEIDANRPTAIELRAVPQGESQQGFDMAGSLSRIFARYVAGETMRDGEVIALRAPLQTQWFGALRSVDGLARMPLWRFIQEPNYDGLFNTIDQR